jgi:hypothetical protein
MEKEEQTKMMAELENAWCDAVEHFATNGKGDPKVYAMASRWFDYVFGNCVLACKKNRDYSRGRMSPIRLGGMEGISVRIVDKTARLFNLVMNPKRAVPMVECESIRDTLRDLSNYGIIGEMLMDDVFDIWYDE